MDTFRHNPGRVSHVAVISLFSFFAAVAVAVRLWARKVQRSRWEANDYLCIVALVRDTSIAATFVEQFTDDITGLQSRAITVHHSLLAIYCISAILLD